ncbi:MAG: lipocalin family protein [Methyloversatilis sp.]|jgi:apolipoprotein D and lipocalin family protein|nr:lipocalin family protein [Methyloversatilis sp.]MBP6194563.1 lipocalin family protein [Methyloversatilis sp.]MBP9116974.1 lipocalin family protein [Methyloversatilis sp.]
MKLRTIALLTCLLPFGAAAQYAPDEKAELATIATLDVSRYLGTWYEIARFPNWFQRNCASDTRAEYSLDKQGSLQVINRCRREDGEFDQVTGAARQEGTATSPKLKVRFAPAWLSFIPVVWGNYWVIDLDADYRLVAVSEPTRDYLWVLSRTPTVDPQAYEALLARLATKGLDVTKLERTPHRTPAP